MIPRRFRRGSTWPKISSPPPDPMIQIYCDTAEEAEVIWQSLIDARLAHYHCRVWRGQPSADGSGTEPFPVGGWVAHGVRPRDRA